MTKYIVDLYLDGYPTQAEQDATALEFIHEQLNFSGSSVKVEKYNAGWISVNDQLPPRESGNLSNFSVDVLCYDPNGDEDLIRSGYYYYFGGYWVIYDWLDRPGVTHWMPLPLPPTQE